ncbi:thioredoxin domain-containing protein [Pseudoglutamicibacter cumminsii]|uniref:DsbA family protein n=1 Tax=Pseudoglutamicibacter cumminsii TaxID=156979 RepID=UPI0025523045|nr:thioredoxin domain-containing protein [Pseudoglutamicibacter cumminsii]MDZ3744510.1 thioredoxin domain-containing protein [Pseudoglutamicibacter cumminsii]
MPDQTPTPSEAVSSQATADTTPTWRKYLFPAIVIVAAVVAIVLVLVLRGGDGGNGNKGNVPDYAAEDAAVDEQRKNQGEQNSEEQARLELIRSLPERNPDDTLAVGEPNAPVQMIMYSDFQCGFCALWTTNTLPVLMEKYVEPGNLRIEFREANVFGEESVKAAQAAAAAGEQGKFLEFQKALYPGGKPMKSFPEDKMVEIAEDLGLEAEKFKADMGSQKIADLVAQHQHKAAELGVTSTPMFIVGTQPVSGAQPTEQFELIVEQQLDQERSQQDSE